MDYVDCKPQTRGNASAAATESEGAPPRRGETAGEPPPQCLHALFEARARHAPDAVAVVYKDEALTYGELNERANQVAHYLRRQGVGPETLVGLLMDRSPELVVGLLAILKAGGAYLPLDPEYPQERLRFMLEDARAHLVLTQERPRQSVSESAARVVCLDTDAPAIGAESRENPAPRALADNAAYVIYTSGSTGRPKGVVVTHANVARLFRATGERFGFGPSDVWTLFHSYAFDFSVWELWGALLYGGCLVVVPYWESRTPDRFYQLLVSEGVTVLNQTPSAFRQLMPAASASHGDGGSQPSLRLVIFGGEALEMRSLNEWFAGRPEGEPRMINMYGITETTVHVTCRQVTAADARAGGGSMIGRPLDGVELYVLDKELRQAPVGEEGELYVGGGGLARGYLGRPALTAERFVPHPYGAEAGARLYRSGDVGRRTADGDVEYLGRADTQVKVRGFRIELGEIEAALRSHPAVADAAVVLRTEETGERLLVAYTVARPGAGAPPDELRRHLQGRLPDYMMPAAFVPLERLPLTAHGKVDRCALPAPGGARPETGESYVAPRDEVEEALAAVWSQVLRVDRVGVYDNFFDLGGDSVRSVQVIALAKERGLDFSVQQLFQKQTIAMLAGEVSACEGGAATPQRAEPFSLIGPEDRRKLPEGVEDAYPLAMMQAGMLYHMAYTPDEMIYHNTYGYHIRARCDVAVLREVLREVTASHPILRTSFDLGSYSEPLQLVHEQVVFPLDADDISHLPGGEQEEVLDAFFEGEKWRRFDLSSPPLLRLHVHRRSADRFQLTMSECHPIFDGWSLHSLLAEVFTRYFARLNGAPAPGYESPSSTYSDFVRLERAALESEESRRFWAEKLRGAAPVEAPRWTSALPPQEGLRIRNLTFPLPEELTQNLKQLARSLRVPFRTVLLAAHVKVMSMISGRADVLTGMVSVGRPETTDGERVLGLFFNTLPFRLELPRAATWADLVRRTFEAELEILPHRRYPTAMLQKQWGRKPLFETIFNYLHFDVIDDVLAAGDMEVLDANRAWEETNLTLSTAFMMPPLASHLLLTLRYDVRALHEGQVRAVSEYYKNVLQEMAGAPGAAHDSQSFLSEEERRRELSSALGDTKQSAARARGVHELFEEQAEKNPGALAVVHEDERLTYGDLNGRANQLAHYLRGLGVGPEVPVGIYLERSAETLVCMLGVLKAGGACVPLDAAHPPAGLASMLDESGVRVVLTRQGLSGGLPEGGATLVRLDADGEQVSRQPVHNPRAGAAAENMACVYFTSGSTGPAKAVAVEHRQLLNYTGSIVARLGLTAGLSYAMVSPFHTDLGNTMIFPALATGGSLHVISQARVSDAQALAARFEQDPPDCLKIVPGHLSALLAASPDERILPRRRLVLGGESSSWELVEAVKRLRPEGCAVFNHYGPTETTVGVLAHRAELDDARDAATLPLGRPLDNARVYILDPNLHPVPLGAPGEIYIGGAGVARGYVNRPGLTAEKFIPDPFGVEPGARMYRTGDRARRLLDGAVEFLGRDDHQVKIRGFRVELQAVETALREHPSVRQAVALVGEDASGAKQLVAYVVPEGGGEFGVAELRRHLKQLLPSHMIPSSFVPLDELPLTPNGKLDRSALHGRQASAARGEDGYVAPRSAAERAIRAVWQDVLQQERVGIHDNFFDVGGHSFLMLQAQSKLQAAFGRDISIVEMFEHPTIGSLAEHLAASEEQARAFQSAERQAASRRESLLGREGVQQRRRRAATGAPGEPPGD